MIKKKLLLALFFIPFIALSFQGSTVTLIQGFIYDESGNPVGADIKFINSVGKKIMLKSNSKDGSFQQPFVQGEKYFPIFKGYVLANGFESFEVIKTGKYEEITRNFTVKRIQSNLNIMSEAFFKDGDSILSADAKEYLRVFKEFYNYNKNLTFRAVISAPDKVFKPTSRKVQVKVKNKTRTKTIKISSKDLESDFIQSRINQLTKALKELEIPLSTFNFEKKIKTNPSKTAVNNNNLEIYIDQIKNL